MNQLIFLATLAWRNLWRSKRRTVITFSSVGFAVFLAIAMESVNAGQHEQIVANMVRMSTGYLQFQDSSYWEERSMDNSFELRRSLTEKIDRTLGNGAYAVPRIESFALVAGTTNTRAALVTGVDFEKENRIIGIADKLVEGSIPNATAQMALVPVGIAEKLQLGVGDTVVVVGQGYQGLSAAGKYPISGLIKFPIPQQNDLMVYLPLVAAQELFAAEGRLTSLLLMAETEDQLVKKLPALEAMAREEGLKLMNWKSLSPDMVSALEFDKVSGRVMLMILYVVIGFGIFGTILTMTLEREKEFGSMLSLGMRRWKLAYVSLLETCMICTLGIACGVLMGYPLTYYFYANPIPLQGEMAKAMEEYGMEAIITFSIKPEVYIRQAEIVFVIAFLVASYPIWRIFTLNILKTIRS